ncbi:MAG TPA: hypothetical protein VGO76_19985 [Luteibacter sp.]|jgi:hypothetical protein|nr:hypothetical protein [Luteibacter sp.]
MPDQDKPRARPPRPDLARRSAASVAGLANDSSFREQVEGTIRQVDSAELWQEHDVVFGELEKHAAQIKNDVRK